MIMAMNLLGLNNFRSYLTVMGLKASSLQSRTRRQTQSLSAHSECLANSFVQVYLTATGALTLTRWCKLALTQFVQQRQRKDFYLPAQLAFGYDMLFRQKIFIDWERFKALHNKQAMQNNVKENKKRLEHQYQVGDKVLILLKPYEPQKRPKISPTYSCTAFLQTLAH